MSKFLIVEDSQVIQKILRHIAKQELDREVLFAASMAEAKALYADHKHELIAGIIDIALPDAPNGELVDFLLEDHFPLIVLTGTDDGERRQSLLKKGAADYVLKESRYSYQYAVQMLSRLEKNSNVKILVVDDSRQIRQFVTYLLKLHRYQVFEAEDGLVALQILDKEPDIHMVLTDYHMPNLNGFELVQQIRQRYEKTPIAVIGLSSQGDSHVSVQFIKNGANDFLPKPFEHEEFFCRVTNNIESLERMLSLKLQATKDYLTGLNNRRYFAEEGDTHLRRCQTEEIPICLAMIDIDLFKRVNDGFGHLVGDQVLKQFAYYLDDCFGRFITARTGGEEFSILLSGLQPSQARSLLEEFRIMVEELEFEFGDGEYLRLTISIGMSVASGDSLDSLLQRADQHLYAAKDSGRNMLVSDSIMLS
ncbi:diguanylate cyclase [Thalassolituus oleivorans]|uniref:diguanylate cyclase n=1 Tax=Thalassolituus oleivorans TaxID=187493 RepID=UPI0023F05D1E|nr:diguanylate cyclase [Thalassolituus oleivorans]